MIRKASTLAGGLLNPAFSLPAHRSFVALVPEWSSSIVWDLDAIHIWNGKASQC